MELYNYYTLFFLSVIVTAHHISGKVFELSRSNFAQFKKSARFALVFIDSNYTDCMRCRRMFPFFMAASQNFEEDREIAFGRLHGYQLINSSLTHQVPAVYYYAPESTTPQRMFGDITVDNIMETIANNMYGYFGDSKKVYAIEVDGQNFNEIVLRPIQYVMLLLYNKASKETVTMINDVAEAFRHDEEIIFCKLNADKNKKFVDEWFKLRKPPKVFWYHFKLKEEKKTFGGGLSTAVLISFVNENTHLWRSNTGRLMPKAGRIKELDDIIQKYVTAIHFGFEENLAQAIEEMDNFKPDLNLPWEKGYAEYYVSILMRAAEQENLDFLIEERDRLIVSEGDGSLSIREKDSSVRKLNVIAYIMETIADYIMKYVSKEDLKKLEKEKKKRRREKKKLKKMKKEHVHEEL